MNVAKWSRTEALWAKVVVQPGCWSWRGEIDKRTGYAVFSYKGTRVVAHRAVYELIVAPVPDGLVLDHLCRNRACVNPSHVEPVTIGENVRRGMSPRIVAWRTDTCLRGHALEGENVKWQQGRRACRACLTNAPSNRSRNGSNPTTQHERQSA